MILQGFCPPRGVVKKPFSGYNMSYFLHAVFRTGKRRRDKRKFQFSVGISCADGRVRQRHFGKLKARLCRGRGKLYRKGL